VRKRLIMQSIDDTLKAHVTLGDALALIDRPGEYTFDLVLATSTKFNPLVVPHTHVSTPSTN
jgi:hypothetical protein